VLPPWPTYIKDGLEKNKFRIKTIKLRGQISQGYCIPISVFSEHPTRRLELQKTEENNPVLAKLVDQDSGECIELRLGTDVTLLLDIGKYLNPHEEVDEQAFGNKAHNHVNRALFPSEFLHKTNQERIQNMGHLLQSFADMEFEVTEKLDGSSVTAYYYINPQFKAADGFGLCSRNFRLSGDEPEPLATAAWGIASALGLRERLEKYGKHLALQGEICGDKFQGNPYQLRPCRWFIFDVYLIDDQRYATPSEREQILKDLNLADHAVPTVEKKRTLSGMKVADIVGMADGMSLLNPRARREGLVFKSVTLTERGRTVSFKAVSNVWLLKNTAK